MRDRFRKVYERIDEINPGWIFLLRAVPLIPYRVLDISFGLSRLPFVLTLIVAFKMKKKFQ